MEEFLADCRLPEYDCRTYVTLFREEAITLAELPLLNAEVLYRIGVKLGHSLKIIDTRDRIFHKQLTEED